jgi:hypothetical protein
MSFDDFFEHVLNHIVAGGFTKTAIMEKSGLTSTRLDRLLIEQNSDIGDLGLLCYALGIEASIRVVPREDADEEILIPLSLPLPTA